MSLPALVLSLADNKQLLGLRYAEWATRAPSLEADIAAAAMGLDDLAAAYARATYDEERWIEMAIVPRAAMTTLWAPGEDAAE